MFLTYVDESGDPGMVASPCRFYVLSALVVHEHCWRSVLEQILQFRRRMRDAHGLKLRDELHSARMINKPGDLVRIQRNDRLRIIREFADELANLPGIDVINLVVDKQGKTAAYDVFGHAWTTLIQRLEQLLATRSLGDASGGLDCAMIFPDDTDNRRLRDLMRWMRFERPLQDRNQTGRNRPILHVIEDPVPRDSTHSYLIQAADLVAFLLYQELAPSGYMRRKGGHNYFNRLEPILCTAAERSDARGIVRL